MDFVLKQYEIDWITQNWTPLTPMKSTWQEKYSWMDFDRSGRITSNDALIALKAGEALGIGLNTLAQDILKISVGNDRDIKRDYSRVKETDLRHLYYPEESQEGPDTPYTPGTSDITDTTNAENGQGTRVQTTSSNLNLFLIGGGLLLLLYLFSKKGGGK